MKILWIYLGISLVWAVFSVYKNRTTHSIKGSFMNNVIVFFMNLLLFPAMLYFAIRDKKLFHRHKWIYHDYVPYGDKNTPHGAGYRVCEKCNLKQTNWKIIKI